MSANDPHRGHPLIQINPDEGHSVLSGSQSSRERTMTATRSIWLGLSTTVAVAIISGLPAAAQQITGTPGSPGATTTIDGKYLPPPPPKFGGDINLQASQSKPYWPPASCRRRAPPTCS
jgi:hypothetical protein